VNADEWAQIHRASAEGETIKGIAARLGMSRNTVRRALSLTEPPDDHRAAKGSATDAADRDIRELLLADPEISIAEIGRQIGWTRSRTLLARKVGRLRSDTTADLPRNQSPSSSPGIPQPATSFVGRRSELGELRALLGEHRLVSIVGPGGMGKTRLAIRAADEFRRAFPDGVRFVDLTIVRSEELLAQTVCDLLAIDTRDAHDRAAEDSLVNFLRNRRMLLILDNCEHVVDAVAALAARLVESTPNLRILATSREFLSIPGEYVFHLSALPIDGPEAVSPAVELFARRAAAVLAGFTLDEENRPDVQRICRRLDGLPLAIELACTRLNLMSVGELADMLERRMSMLTVGSRGRTSRHRSLQATIDWSYELCSAAEQLLWSRLSVFVGGFDMQTAAQVCADDELPEAFVMEAAGGLVAKSVVIREADHGQARFRMLESIREYGWGKLPQPGRDRVNARLLQWCARIIVDSAEHWYGPEQLTKATVVEQNRGNVRAALEHAVASRDDAALTAPATLALGRARFLWACGISAREHRIWLTKALDLTQASPADKTRMFGVLALLQTLQGDRESAAYSLQRARELAEREHDAETAAFAIHTDGLRDFFAGDFDSAGTKFTTARTRYAQIDAEADLVATLGIHRGMLLSATNEIDAAADVFAEVYAATEAVGEQWYHSYATYGLGLVAFLSGDASQATGQARRAMNGHRQFGDIIGMTLMSDLLGWSLVAQGDSEQATVVLGAASAMWGSIGQQLYGSDHWNSLRANAVEQARADLGTAGFQRWWATGESMSVAELLDYVFDDGAAGTDPARRLAGQAWDSLSQREREVAELVVEGLTNKEVAARLVLSTRTVEGHVERILHKLNIGRRAQIATVVRGGADETAPRTRW